MGWIMNKFAMLLALGAFLVSCQGTDKKTDAAANDDAKTGYAFGVLIGTNLKSTGVKVDYDAFVKGMKDVLEKNAPTVTPEVANTTVQAALTDAHTKLAAANVKKEEDFLASNGKKTGVKTTASGLQYEVITEGTGAKPKATDTVKVDYVGTLVDGTVFDSSIERKQPAVFPLDGVIPGWTEGIQLMTVGSKYKLYIPSKLAYGENGAGTKIGPNSTLVFEVTLLSIEAPAKK
jgi:FKBP-type peptidyl-prolyl cis-trans isomerase FkpA